MHSEAYAGFGRMIEQSGLDRHAALDVLDIGGQNVNGTVHDYFTHPQTTVTTLDLENADIVADARTWIPDRQFDVVIATEVFEHVEDWPMIIETMRDACADDGVLIATCASDRRQPHGATGAPLPASGEWYRNVTPEDLREALRSSFMVSDVDYQWPPGDAYMWARPVGEHITVVIPTIPTRSNMLRKALDSVAAQILQPCDVIVETAAPGEGPAVVRNRALEKVGTPWVAFLDDDDWLYPDHLWTLARTAVEYEADVVWPWFDVDGGRDPFPMHRGRQWNPDDPHQIPITVLADVDAIRDVGGFKTIADGPTDRDGNRAGEDWDLWLRLSAEGYRFRHVDYVTWVWRHHRGNTSGLPSRVR